MATEFLAKFKRYIPEGEARSALEGAVVTSCMVDSERKIVDMTISMKAPIKKTLVASIERDMLKAYELSSVVMRTQYPPESWYDDYIHEIIAEAKRFGALSRGFFDSYRYKSEGDTITITIPFPKGGIELLNAAKEGEFFEKIIYREFSRNIKIIIDGEENAQSLYDDFERSRQSELEAMGRAVAAAAASREQNEEKDKKEKEEKENDAPKLERVSSIVSDKAGAEQIDESTFRSGVMTFDISSPEEIFGTISTVPLCAISELKVSGKRARVCGRVDTFEASPMRSGNVSVSIGLTDNTSSITVKRTFKPEDCEAFCAEIRKRGRTIMRGIQEVVTVYDLYVMVSGDIRADDEKFGGELYLRPTGMHEIKRVLRTDTAEEKRVELHMHSNFSQMDALIFPEFVVDTALRWGWDALAITDHGNAQSYPIFMEYTAKKAPFKMIYGMEAYYVDDTARAVYGDADCELESAEFTVFDIETTGLSPISCKITEIGAVKVKGGEVLERFNTFVDPEGHIPEEITRLTGITDEMVKGAPSQEEAVRAFLDFANGDILIAHNANFDTGFIRSVCEQYRIPFTNTYLDTVALSRYVNPDLKRHKLDDVAEYFHLGDFNHHRACDDAEMLSLIFFAMSNKLREEGVRTLSSIITAMSDNADPLKLRTNHMNILVKNPAGLKNLYRLISDSYLKYYRRHPRVPKSLLEAHRDGLLIGSACSDGELYSAILEGKPHGELKKIASFYDFLEIMPVSNDGYLINEGTVANEEALRDINRKIVALGEELGKIVVATDDAHFMEPEDEIYRKILLKGMKFSDGDRDTGLFLHTTNEMLDEFAYLGKEKAYEVVVKNTRAISDMIEAVRPIPDGTFTPNMDGAEEELQKMCWDRAHELYGDPLPEIVQARLEKELDSIIKHGFAVLYIIAQRLVHKSESEGYLVGSRGSVGSSFVATMAGISEVNPLTAHYRCPKCKKTIFDPSFDSGFDMPPKDCPDCAAPMMQDGQNIPFETFLGFKGDKSPDIDLNFSGEVQGKIHKYTEELFGRENVFKAGTLGTLASKTAYGYVMKYLEEKGVSVNRAEANRLVNGCVGVKRTTGQHPGGIVVIPKEYDVYDFTPVQHPADDPDSDIVTTHFPFVFLHDTILKLDELGHDVPTKYKWMENFSGVKVMDIPMNDPEVYELFNSVKPLRLKEEVDFQVGTYGLPEFGTRNAMQMLVDAKPKNFADLMQISGLSHGTDVWHGNAKELIEEGTCTISECVGTRDSIMLTLMQKYGVDPGRSFKIMELVRKNKHGLPIPDDMVDEMREHAVPEWYIDSLRKIKYMFPKAHAAAYVMSAIRLGWYKVHRPLEFYAAFFSVAPDGFDADIVMRGRSAIKQAMRDAEEKIKNKTNSAKDSDLLTSMQMVDESMARGIRYLPVDIYKSDSKRFLPEDGKIRIPFSALAGLGESAAEKIVAARAEGEFFSKLELQERAGISKAVMETLDGVNALEGLSETNQITLF